VSVSLSGFVSVFHPSGRLFLSIHNSSSLCQFVFSLISAPPSSASSAMSLSISSLFFCLPPVLCPLLFQSKFHPFDKSTDVDKMCNFAWVTEWKEGRRKPHKVNPLTSPYTCRVKGQSGGGIINNKCSKRMRQSGLSKSGRWVRRKWYNKKERLRLGRRHFQSSSVSPS